MSQSLGDAFKRKLEESRARIQSECVPMEFAGFPCKVRVLPRLHFIRAGRMPDHLTRLIIERNKHNNEAADKLVREASAEQTIQAEIFMREAVCAVLIEPKVVPIGDAPEGGYTYGELIEDAPAFAQVVYQWIMSDCPMPKGEKGDEVLRVEDLENFPEDGGRGAGAQSGNKRKKRGATASRTDAADRK